MTTNPSCTCVGEHDGNCALAKSTQTALETLQGLLNAAREAKDVYWEAARAVEKHIGLDCDEIDLCTEDMVDLSAEDLMAMVDKYNG